MQEQQPEDVAKPKAAPKQAAPNPGQPKRRETSKDSQPLSFCYSRASGRRQGGNVVEKRQSINPAKFPVSPITTACPALPFHPLAPNWSDSSHRPAQVQQRAPPPLHDRRPDSTSISGRHILYDPTPGTSTLHPPHHRASDNTSRTQSR
ncbi:hypothetical protein CT0861_13169 [Colletotrichum tofieldiae]|uniref:Uncharacterized protein n=1 Tax=Colletotrichum tofieldiae TaxID=708197 RepID=A0A166Q9H4_9PEZI|nr:hypothetical protein CT0861_13169 [Colletotrichum tofieldiae]